MKQPVRGNREPRVFTPPLAPLEPRTPETEARTFGYSVIDFARDWLGVTLYPWQEFLLIHGLELKPDRTGFRFRTLVVLVARQNGKSTLGQVLALWALYVLKVPLIVGTAQDLATAETLWEDVVDIAQDNDALAAMVKTVNRRNGARSIVVEPDPARKSKAEYKVKASTRKAARGLSSDLLLLDELREHTNWEAWGAVTKDLPNSTPILMADGSWSEIGDIQVGDRVFAPSGQPVRVTEVHPVAELRPMYRVTTSDGRSLVASESHLWTVKDMRKSYDLSARWETLSTGEILARGLKRNRQEYAFRLPNQGALQELPEKDLPLDPYILGCWLGDGTSRDGTITVGAEDLEATSALLTAAGAEITSSVEHRPGTWMLRLHVGGVPLITVLRRMGLLQNKHVPDAYLTASAGQRLALLQGLIDTDGCITARGLAKFTGTRECLSDAVLFLARSLGWNARKSSHIPKLGNLECARAWAVTFTVRRGDVVPVRIPRKAARCGASDAPEKLASIVSIEPVETESSTCIAVDSDEHLFLAGRDLVPTHNTMMARPRAQTWALSNAGDELSVVLMSLRKKAHAALGDPDGINKDTVEEEAPLVADQSLGVFEWSAAPGRDKWDKAGWCEANPSLGYGALTEEALAAAAATDPDPVFRTECLCQWILGSLEGPFPNGTWEKCADPTGQIMDDSELSFCVDVAVDRSTGWIAVCGSQESGRPQVEVVTGRSGGGWQKWMPEWFERYTAPDASGKPSREVRVVVPARGMNPVAAVIDDLEKVPGVTVIPWGGADMSIACGLMYDRVTASEESPPPLPPLAHRDQEALNLAAATAAQRVMGDGWYWDRRNSIQDVSPLVAATGALWDHLRVPEEVAPPSVYSFGVMELM